MEEKDANEGRKTRGEARRCRGEMEGECEMSQSRGFRRAERETPAERRMGWDDGNRSPADPRFQKRRVGDGGLMQERRARTGAPQVMERYTKKMEGTGREGHTHTRTHRSTHRSTHPADKKGDMEGVCESGEQKALRQA